VSFRPPPPPQPLHKTPCPLKGKLRRQCKTTPHITKEKETIWYRAPYNSSNNRKKKEELRRQGKTTPHINQGKGATLVPGHHTAPQLKRECPHFLDLANSHHNWSQSTIAHILPSGASSLLAPFPYSHVFLQVSLLSKPTRWLYMPLLTALIDSSSIPLFVPSPSSPCSAS
jgi:hypothetical protein